ncbi:MAG: hypothetical protein RI894_1855 [Bacteroidota bacterium]|jgi:hypothetical protein
MKKLQLQPGGVPRKNDTFVHLQSGLTESLTAMCTAFLTHNTATAVVLHGCEFSATTGIANMTPGSIFADGEICKVQAVNGLDMSLNIYFEKSTGYLPPLLYADGNLKYTYAENIYIVYAAASKNDPADLQLGVEVVRFDTAMKNVVNFDNGAFLPSAQDSWRLINNFLGQPPINGILLELDWTAFNFNARPKIKKTQTNIVCVSGEVQTTVGTPIIFWLPIEYRPTQDVRIICRSNAQYTNNARGNGIAEIVIGYDGRVAFENGSLASFNLVISLDFTFLAG